jgi:uncharacterized protein (UPF0332 family)
MKPEAADYLAKARATLADAQQIAALSLPHVAAREAYYAAFHAAEAYIFEHTGKVATTHKGVRIEFARLARREPRIDRELTRFLATAYQLRRRQITALAQPLLRSPPTKLQQPSRQRAAS